MATRSVTFTAPAAGWVQLSPSFAAAGGPPPNGSPDPARVEFHSPGPQEITFDDEGWHSWTSTAAVLNGSVESGPDIQTSTIEGLLAASVARRSAAPSGGGGSVPGSSFFPSGSSLGVLPLRPGQPAPTVGFFGDSWSTEAMMGAGFNLPAAVSRILGCIPVISAVDGSGFAHSPTETPDNRFEVDSRVNSVCSALPNLIVTIGSLNSDKVIENGDSDGTKITTAVQDFIRKVRAKLPAVPIVMIGAEPSSVSRLLSRPSHINVKAHKAGVEAAGGVDAGVAFVDWIGIADRQAVPWRDGRQCAEGDVVVYNGVAYRVTREWAPAAGETPADSDAPTLQVSDVLSGTGHEGSKKGDGTRDGLLMSDETHPTKLGSIAFGAAAAKHISAALSTLSPWITTHGPVAPAKSATPGPLTPPAPKPAGLPIMAWLQSGWGTADRVAYSKEDIDAIIALKPDRISLPLRRTDDTIGESGDAGVAIPAQYTGTDGEKRNFSDGSIAGIAGRGVKVASMLESLDAMEAAGITPMPNPRDGLEDYSAQWTTNSSEKIAAKLASRKDYEVITGRAENSLRVKLKAAVPNLTFVSDNTDGPADWQVSDAKNASVGILGPTAGAPGWGAAKEAFPSGVWALVSNKDDQSTAKGLADAAGVKILGWAVSTPEALAAIKG